MDSLTTFTDQREFERAAALLDAHGIDHTLISPDPAYRRVGCPAVVLSDRAKATFLESAGTDILSTGWVDFRQPVQPVPDETPPEYNEDIVGRVAIVVLAPCVADHDRLRLTAHVSGDVADALPYLSAEMAQGLYVSKLPCSPSWTAIACCRSSGTVSGSPRRMTSSMPGRALSDSAAW